MERPSVIVKTDGRHTRGPGKGKSWERTTEVSKKSTNLQKEDKNWAANFGCCLAYEMICRENYKERLAEEEKIMESMPVLERESSYPPPDGIPSDITEYARSSSGTPPPSVRKKAKNFLYRKRKIERILYLKRQLRTNAAKMLIGLVIHNTGSPCTIPMIHNFFEAYYTGFIDCYHSAQSWKYSIEKALDQGCEMGIIEKVNWPKGSVAYTTGSLFDIFHRQWKRKMTILEPYLTGKGRVDQIFFGTMEKREILQLYKVGGNSGAWLNRFERTIPRKYPRKNG